MGGDNRRHCACGDRDPPSRRARDRHLCGQWPCQDAFGSSCATQATRLTHPGGLGSDSP